MYINGSLIIIFMMYLDNNVGKFIWQHKSIELMNMLIYNEPHYKKLFTVDVVRAIHIRVSTSM